MTHPTPDNWPAATSAVTPYHPNHDRGLSNPREDLASLTPAQHAQLEALVSHAVAVTTRHYLDEQPTPATRRSSESVLREPGVLIVLMMLTVIAVATIVALTVILGLAVIG